VRAIVKLLGMLLLLAAGAAQGQNPPPWVEGTHYFRVEPPQATTTPGKIELLDVFSYACPACNAFQPTLEKLRAQLPPQAQIAYLPASFNPSEDWPVFQRAFLAAQTLGIAEKSHNAMYDAIWGSGSLTIKDNLTGRPLPVDKQPTIEAVAKFYTNYGVTEEAFLRVARSFSVDSQMKRSDARLMADGVDSTPTLIVNGKYRFTPNSAGGYENTIALALYLIARERAAP